MSHRRAPNFCSSCGGNLQPGDAYCSQCGTRVGSDDSSGRSTRRGWFRRRLEDLTVDGWEIEQDHGDRAVVVRRGLGSIWIHLLLLLFTGGIGNLVYAWYCYSVGADRVEVRADGTRRRLNGNDDGIDASAVASTLSFVAAALLAWIGVTIFMGLSVGLTVLGACLFVAAGLGLPSVRRRLGTRRSLTTFGRVRETDERIVNRPRTPCSACASPVNTGVERTYGARLYIAGVPVSTHQDGTNVYCRSCANGDAPESERAASESESKPGSESDSRHEFA